MNAFSYVFCYVEDTQLYLMVKLWQPLLYTREVIDFLQSH